MTKNQKAHLQTIGTIVGSVIAFILLLIVTVLFPGPTFGLLCIVFFSSIGYVLYMMIYDNFKREGK